MALPIIEQPLEGQIQLETAAWVTPFVWVDRTSDLNAGLSYSEGGRTRYAGGPITDVGTLSATFVNPATTPLVGDLVRLRIAGTTKYMFTGFVQDISQQIVFDNSVSYNTPITLVSIVCLDWVGYISQFNSVGAGGCDVATGVAFTESHYRWHDRCAALNKSIDSTYATKIIALGPYASNDRTAIGDTDFVGSLSAHLDLISHSCDIIWRGEHVLPTNKTTGRTGLVTVKPIPTIVKTFTDVAGTAGQLHYTEIDFLNSSTNISNTIVVNNRVRLHLGFEEITKIGGFNEENYMIVDNQNIVGVATEHTEKKTDQFSVASYGERRAEVQTNVAIGTQINLRLNLVANPSAEYSDDGYTGGTGYRTRRRQPLNDANSFASKDGSWAIRQRVSTAQTATGVDYSGGEADGIPVVAGNTYYLKISAARGTVSRTDVRAISRILWYDDDETLLSTSSGSFVNLTTANTWYTVPLTATAPANAVRAKLRINYNRSGGGNHSVGDRLWADAFILSKNDIEYFDGDTPYDEFWGYRWTGGVGESQSVRFTNQVDNQAATILARYASTSNKPIRIRYNAQEDLNAVPDLIVGNVVEVIYKGTTTSQRILGIDATIDPERYMIDYYLAKDTFT